MTGLAVATLQAPTGLLSETLAARKARLARFETKAREIIDRRANQSNRKLELALVTEIKKAIDPAPVADSQIIDEWVERQLEIAAPLFETPAITILRIQKVTAKHFGFKISDLKCEYRYAGIVRARQVAFYLCKTMTRRSLPEIGFHFGKRDHTTILHGVQKIRRLMKDDSGLADLIETLRAELMA